MQKYIHMIKEWWAGFKWQELSRTAWQDIAFWSVVAGGLFFMFHLHGNVQEVPTVGHSIFRWLNSRWFGDYAYCQFLPFASIAAVWLQRKKLAAAAKQVDFRAVAFIVIALFMHWIGVRAQQPRISVAAFILLLWSLPFLFYGLQTAKLLLFPCAYLILAIPLNFIDSMTAPLRLFATQAAALVLNGIGIPVLRIGSGLYSSDASSFSFHVAPECSGLRSLLAMTALIAFYAWYSQKTPVKKWLLFLLSIPIAILANICRIVLVVVIGAFFGQETAMGLWHDYSGYPIFLISILLVLAADHLINMNYHTVWTKLKNLFLSREVS